MRRVASEDFVFDTAEPVPVACCPEGRFFRKSAFDALESREVACRVRLFRCPGFGRSMRTSFLLGLPKAPGSIVHRRAGVGRVRPDDTRHPA